MASVVQKLVGPTQEMYKLHILNISTNSTNLAYMFMNIGYDLMQMCGDFY